MSQDGEEKYTRGMVVVAHADDAEYGCSGTVAKLCAEGWEMVYVLCTDGSKGSSDREITQSELASMRRQEQIDAGKVLGLKDVVFLDHEDSMLQPTLELRRDIAREIRRHRPDVVLCPYPMRSLDGGWGRRPSRPSGGGRGDALGGLPGCPRPHDLPRAAGGRFRAPQGGRGVGHRPSRPRPVDRRDGAHGYIDPGAPPAQIASRLRLSGVSGRADAGSGAGAAARAGAYSTQRPSAGSPSAAKASRLDPVSPAKAGVHSRGPRDWMPASVGA